VARIERHGNALLLRSGSFAEHAGLEYSAAVSNTWTHVTESVSVSLCPGDRICIGNAHPSKISLASVYYRVRLVSTVEALDPYLSEWLKLWCAGAVIGSVAVAAADSLVEVSPHVAVAAELAVPRR
jgi:hypothetical protein